MNKAQQIWEQELKNLEDWLPKYVSEKHTDSQVVSQMPTLTHTNFSDKRQNNQTQGRGINPI